MTIAELLDAAINARYRRAASLPRVATSRLLADEGAFAAEVAVRLRTSSMSSRLVRVGT